MLLKTKKKYKPVALKTRPLQADLPEKFRIQRRIIGDPLADMPILDPNPPPFTPGVRYTEERRAKMRGRIAIRFSLVHSRRGIVDPEQLQARQKQRKMICLQADSQLVVASAAKQVKRV